MSKAEELRDVMAAIEAVKSEISITSVYVGNEERWLDELKREETKLQRQQERVDRLRARREDGPAMIARYEGRLIELKAEAAALKNAVKVERMRELFRQANALEGEISDETLANLRQQFGLGGASAE